jgi:creatinine amidohydrolase
MKLAEMTWPDVAALDEERVVVVAPYAACEQHSRHLPFYTDTLLVTAVAEGVEAKLPESVLLLPSQWLGASAHHLPFLGTLTADLETHVRMMVDPLTPLLEGGFRRVLILNGHGGNIDTMHLAARQLQPRFPRAIIGTGSYWEIAHQEIADRLTGPRKSVGHACEAETCLMLAVRPDLVRRDQIKDDHMITPPALDGIYFATDFATRSNAGAIGYPEKATEAQGRDMLAAIIDRVAAAVETLQQATPETLWRQEAGR